MNKQLIKEVIKEMIRDGEISVNVRYDDDTDWFSAIEYNGEVQECVVNMSFDLKVKDE